MISNVPGPPFPLYLGGCPPACRCCRSGRPIEGAGLNITVMSYVDRIDWGFIACRELAPHLEDMARAVEEAHRELAKAAQIAEDGDGPEQ